MHGVTESRPVTVRMEARPWRSGNKTTEWATKLALTRSAFSWKGRSTHASGERPRFRSNILHETINRFRRVLRPYGRFGSTVVHGIIRIIHPLSRVLPDVLADTREVRLVADDVLVIIPLPDRRARSAADIVDATGCVRFERSHDCTKRPGQNTLRRQRGGG